MNQQEEIYIRAGYIPVNARHRSINYFLEKIFLLRMAQEVISTSNSQQKDYYKNCIDLFKKQIYSNDWVQVKEKHI